jgi:hypothetical protein
MQFSPKSAADKSAMSGNKNFGIFVHRISCIWSNIKNNYAKIRTFSKLMYLIKSAPRCQYG